MRRAICQQPLVVGIGPLTPATIGVVAGLLGDDRLIVVGEVDLAVIVGAGWFRVETVHEKNTSRVRDPSPLGSVGA